MMERKSNTKERKNAANVALAAKQGRTDPSILAGLERELYDQMSEEELQEISMSEEEESEEL